MVKKCKECGQTSTIHLSLGIFRNHHLCYPCSQKWWEKVDRPPTDPPRKATPVQYVWLLVDDEKSLYGVFSSREGAVERKDELVEMGHDDISIIVRHLKP